MMYDKKYDIIQVGDNMILWLIITIAIFICINLVIKVLSPKRKNKDEEVEDELDIKKLIAATSAFRPDDKEKHKHRKHTNSKARKNKH